MTPDQVFLKRKEDDIKIIYIVTKPSNDGTFEKGDHIYFTGDGMIFRIFDKNGDRIPRCEYDSYNFLDAQ